LKIIGNFVDKLKDVCYNITSCENINFCLGVPTLNIDMESTHDLKARMKVMGVGGGGNNAVDRMVAEGITNIEFISANTDAKALAKSSAVTKIQLGEKLTKGLGAGGRPDKGKRSAEETRDIIAKAIENTDLLFITAGMGGGTGTGAAPVVAGIAREMGILTVGVVTKPFAFEGGPRMRNALAGIAELRKNVDTLVIIPNERLLAIVGNDVSLVDAFRRADEVLHQGVVGISNIILGEGLVNLDFADVETIMKDQGIAHMGIGSASGKNKFETAIRDAINSPLLETSISGAKAVIISFTGDHTMSLQEIATANSLVASALDPDAEIMFGTTIDDSLKDEVRIAVIATGINEELTNTATPGAKPPTPSISPIIEARRPVTDPYARPSWESNSPPEIQEARKEREELPPIKDDETGKPNFLLPHERNPDYVFPPFLKDFRDRKKD
jgi:cell division protein FtsZ